jgi:hypothetical protein
MKQTAVEWLVDKICTDVEMHDEYGKVNGIEFWNAFRSGTDLSEYINKAKEMEKKDICHFGAKCCFMTTQKKSWTIEELYNETFKNK